MKKNTNNAYYKMYYGTHVIYFSEVNTKSLSPICQYNIIYIYSRIHTSCHNANAYSI